MGPFALDLGSQWARGALALGVGLDWASDTLNELHWLQEALYGYPKEICYGDSTPHRREEVLVKPTSLAGASSTYIGRGCTLIAMSLVVPFAHF